MNKLVDGGKPKSDRVTVRRRPQRGSYDFDSIAAILDTTFLCHIGYMAEGQPYVIPTSFGRDGARLYIHGSAASRMLCHLAERLPVCFTRTVFDGIVLARSAFNHSMNYRSVVVLGKAHLAEAEEKVHALEMMSEHILPGRWADVRRPNEHEIRATSVLALDIEEASAKMRTGPPLDDEEDLAFSLLGGRCAVWSLSRSSNAGSEACHRISLPDYLTQHLSKGAQNGPKR